MTKTLTYTGFAVAFVLVALVFITAKSYSQLAIAVVLYPALTYFALKIFPRKIHKIPEFTIRTPGRPAQKIEMVKREKVDVVDIDKRTFLKIIGATGLSFFLFSLLGKRVETLLFGKALESGSAMLGSPSDGEISTTKSSPSEGYKISETDEGATTTYYGFINKDGAWLIMKADTEAGSFRYAKGNSGFPSKWNNRENLKYDYFHNLF